MTDSLLLGLAALNLAALILTGPRLLAVRAMLRWRFSADRVRALSPGVALGLGIGLVGSVLIAAVPVAGGGAWAAYLLSVLLLLGALAAMDLAWRWLPLPWLLALGASGLLLAFASGEIFPALAGAALGGGLLFALQIGFRVLRGVEGLGTGDVFLAIVMGLHSGPREVMILLSIAAMLALLTEYILGVLTRKDTKRRYGVAFGAHMAFVLSMALLN